MAERQLTPRWLPCRRPPPTVKEWHKQMFLSSERCAQPTFADTESFHLAFRRRPERFSPSSVHAEQEVVVFAIAQSLGRANRWVPGRLTDRITRIPAARIAPARRHGNADGLSVPGTANTRDRCLVAGIGARPSRCSWGSGNLADNQSGRRGRWLLRLWAECPLGVPLWTVRLGQSELTCILPIASFLVLGAC